MGEYKKSRAGGKGGSTISERPQGGKGLIFLRGKCADRRRKKKAKKKHVLESGGKEPEESIFAAGGWRGFLLGVLEKKLKTGNRPMISRGGRIHLS